MSSRYGRNYFFVIRFRFLILINSINRRNVPPEIAHCVYILSLLIIIDLVQNQTTLGTYKRVARVNRKGEHVFRFNRYILREQEFFFDIPCLYIYLMEIKIAVYCKRTAVRDLDRKPKNGTKFFVCSLVHMPAPPRINICESRKRDEILRQIWER